jgi:hypothetical protein
MIFIWKFTDLMEKSKAALPFLKNNDPKVQMSGLAEFSVLFDHIKVIEKETENLMNSYDQNHNSYGQQRAAEVFNESLEKFKGEYSVLGNSLVFALRVLKSGNLTNDQRLYVVDLEKTLGSFYGTLTRMKKMPAGEDMSTITVIRHEMKALMEYGQKMIVEGEYAKEAAKRCISQLESGSSKGFHPAPA